MIYNRKRRKKIKFRKKKVLNKKKKIKKAKINYSFAFNSSHISTAFLAASSNEIS